MEPSDQRQKQWKKVLYEDQGVPDNYVDDSFLEELKKNCTLDTWRCDVILCKTFDRVCLFLVAFVYMHERHVTPHVLFGLSSTLAIIGYAIYLSIGDKSEDASGRTAWDDVKTAIIFVSFGFGLSPLLMTLTETISTDTVYAMTTAMLLAHLLFHDYGADSAIVSQSLSLNAAIFASVCLASRLPTLWHTFTTLTLALEIFALWPSLRAKLKNSVYGSQIALSLLLGVGAFMALFTVSGMAAAIFFSVHIFITFICPAWLIQLQPYKNNIYGPWDEAVVQE